MSVDWALNPSPSTVGRVMKCGPPTVAVSTRHGTAAGSRTTKRLGPLENQSIRRDITLVAEA